MARTRGKHARHSTTGKKIRFSLLAGAVSAVSFAGIAPAAHAAPEEPAKNSKVPVANTVTISGKQIADQRADYLERNPNLWIGLGKSQTVRAGNDITLRVIAGDYTEARAVNETIYLQRWDGSQWQEQATGTTDNDGRTKFNVELNDTTDFRAITLDDEGELFTGESFKITVTVDKTPIPAPQPAAKATPRAEASSAPVNYSSATGEAIVAEAKRHLGKPYVFGSAGPSSFDCSGLTLAVFKQFGISLPHRATLQGQRGSAISQGAAQPGDLIFFGTPSFYHHMGIYIGNGQILHAPAPGQSVKIQNLWTSNYDVRRLA